MRRAGLMFSFHTSFLAVKSQGPKCRAFSLFLDIVNVGAA